MKIHYDKLELKSRNSYNSLTFVRLLWFASWHLFIYFRNHWWDGAWKTYKSSQPSMLHIRLVEIWQKWSYQVQSLSIVILCAALKNATPILVPRPKIKYPRPLKVLLLFVFTEIPLKPQKFNFSIFDGRKCWKST